MSVLTGRCIDHGAGAGLAEIARLLPQRASGLRIALDAFSRSPHIGREQAGPRAVRFAAAHSEIMGAHEIGRHAPAFAQLPRRVGTPCTVSAIA